MKWLVLFLFLVTLASTWSQDPMHVVYDDGNGCYDFEQYDLLQDRKGYIWIAGNSGAFKYNAKQFQHFESQLSPSRALTGLCQDEFGRIWMHDFAGNIFHVANDELQLFLPWKANSSNSFPIIRSSKQKLWIIAEEGISEYKNQQKVADIRLVKKWKLPTSREALSFQNQLFVSGENEVWRIGKTADKITIQGTHPPQFLKAWTSLFEFNKQLYLFVRSENTIYRYNGQSFQKVKTLPAFGDFIALKVIQNQPWLLTRNGLFRLSSNFDPIEQLFTGKACSDLIQDQQGAFWLSTLNAGVILIPDIRTRIFTNANSGGFNKLHQWNKTLIAGTNNGQLYQLSRNQIATIYTAKQQKEISFLSANAYSKSLYFGDFNLHEMGAQVQQLGTNPSIKQLEFISKDVALVADPGGLYLRSFQHVKFNQHDIPAFLLKHGKRRTIEGSNAEVFVLLEERTSRFFLWNQQLLAATKNGLYLIDQHHKQRQLFEGKPIFVTDFEWGNGVLYVATSNQGLLSWNGKIWRKVALDESLTPFTFIQHVAFANNELWLATDVGIIQWNLRTKKQQVIDQSNGLITTRITDMVVFNNAVYLSTTKGILKFPTDFHIGTKVNPPLYFSHLKINGKAVDLTEITHIESNPGIVNLQFDALLYGNVNRLVLSYQIDNENKWINLNPGVFTINLTKPQAGEHVIRIRLMDRVTGKTLQLKSLKWYVEPTFFQRLWVQIALGMLILSILIAFSWWYIRIIQRKNQQLLEKERLERELKQSMLSAIKAQMNPHFIFNALNTIQSYVLTNDRMQANFYLGKFSDLMRRILNMSNQDAITLEEELDALSLYLELENMRLNNELEVNIDASAVRDLYHRRIPSMIIQPYIENAIKHGLLHFAGTKRLDIQLHPISAESMEVIITDFGIGRPASYKMKQRSANRHRSFSTDANKKRLDLLNEQGQDGIAVRIEDLEEYGPQTGTRVVLRIPFK